MKSLKFLFPVMLVFIVLSFANGQIIPDNAVMANWNFTLKPDIKADRFEKFMVEDYMPAFRQNFAGVDITLLKGDRGVKKDAYCVLLLFTSVKSRNEWWPADGISSEKTKEATAKLKVQEDRLNSMISWESFTDWIVL